MFDAIPTSDDKGIRLSEAPHVEYKPFIGACGQQSEHVTMWSLNARSELNACCRSNPMMS